MPSSMVSPQPAPEPVRGPRARSQLPVRAVALTPLWLFLILLVAQPTFTAPMMSKPPEFLGLPLGVWVAALVGGWTLAGLALIWDAPSPLRRGVALLVFTIPATFLMIFAPAVILIMQNLG